jgi:hypothetical protein
VIVSPAFVANGAMARGIQPKAEHVEAALPEVDIGKPDKTEAFIHRPGGLHHLGRLQHQAIPADAAGRSGSPRGRRRGPAGWSG